MPTILAVFAQFPNGRDREPVYYVIEREDGQPEREAQITWDEASRILTANADRIEYRDGSYVAFQDDGYIDERLNQYPADMSEAFGQL